MQGLPPDVAALWSGKTTIYAQNVTAYALQVMFIGILEVSTSYGSLRFADGQEFPNLLPLSAEA
jgi:hypothetical protein